MDSHSISEPVSTRDGPVWEGIGAPEGFVPAGGDELLVIVLAWDVTMVSPIRDSLRLSGARVELGMQLVWQMQKSRNPRTGSGAGAEG